MILWFFFLFSQDSALVYFFLLLWPKYLTRQLQYHDINEGFLGTQVGKLWLKVLGLCVKLAKDGLYCLAISYSLFIHMYVSVPPPPPPTSSPNSSQNHSSSLMLPPNFMSFFDFFLIT